MSHANERFDLDLRNVRLAPPVTNGGAFLMHLFVVGLVAAPSALGEQGVNPRLYVEPVPGLTTARYPAPDSITIPVGTMLTVCHSLPTDQSPRSRGGDDDLTIAWDGARSMGIVRGMAMAECPMNEPGEQLIRAVIGSRDGRRWESRCKVTVLAAQRESTRGLRVVPVVDAIPLDENATNFDTMPLFFGGSIATIGPNGSRTAAPMKQHGVRYGTTVGKTVRFGVETAPVKFSDLIEVRPEMGRPFLAANGSYGVSDPGVHRFSVGPLRNPLALVIETYTVRITSHSSGLDIIPEGQPITFEAVTDPPGYESNITWLSSTKYGSAQPVLGRGPTFTAQFDDTWGPDPATGDPIQWLGVKADDVVFNQDQKAGGSGACCNAQQQCFDQTSPGACCGMEGAYLGHGTTCAAVTCPSSDGSTAAIGPCFQCTCCGVAAAAVIISCFGPQWAACYAAYVQTPGAIPLTVACLAACDACFP